MQLVQTSVFAPVRENCIKPGKIRKYIHYSQDLERFVYSSYCTILLADELLHYRNNIRYSALFLSCIMIK